MSNKCAARIYDSFKIRDTGVKQPDPEVGWVETKRLRNIVFGIENDLNQEVSCQIVGRAGGAQGNLGDAVKVAANSSGLATIALDTLWVPYVSVTLTASVAPTSGSITVNAVWIERSWRQLEGA